MSLNVTIEIVEIVSRAGKITHDGIERIRKKESRKTVGRLINKGILKMTGETDASDRSGRGRPAEFIAVGDVAVPIPKVKQPYVQQRPLQDSIVELLRKNSRELTLSQIANSLGYKTNRMSGALANMVRDGKIYRRRLNDDVGSVYHYRLSST